MKDLWFFLVFFMMAGVSLLSSASPWVGRLLVQTAFGRVALVIAVILAVVSLSLGLAYWNEIAPRMAFLVAVGIAPLHQLLLLRYLYGRFIERHGRSPQAATRTAPQADRAFASTNMLLGAFPYLALGLIIASLVKSGR